MAKLSSLRIPTQDVPLAALDGEGITVRGLTFVDLTAIYRQHGAELSVIFSKFVDQGRKLTDDVVKQAIRELVSAAPEAVATAIALASDEPGETENAIRLPMLDQVNLLLAIFALTFRSEAEVKKLVETVVHALGQMNGLLEANSPSLAGFGESGAP